MIRRLAVLCTLVLLATASPLVAQSTPAVFFEPLSETYGMPCPADGGTRTDDGYCDLLIGVDTVTLAAYSIRVTVGGTVAKVRRLATGDHMHHIDGQMVARAIERPNGASYHLASHVELWTHRSPGQAGPFVVAVCTGADCSVTDTDPTYTINYGSPTPSRPEGCDNDVLPEGWTWSATCVKVPPPPTTTTTSTTTTTTQPDPPPNVGEVDVPEWASPNGKGYGPFPSYSACVEANLGTCIAIDETDNWYAIPNYWD